ncbi:MAG TPA: hypothetical protein VF188_11270 [Longimicrobiales bacterium]
MPDREPGGVAVHKDAAATPAARGPELDHADDAHDAAVERELRGRLYQELDLLAFALEMEAAEALENGEPDAAARAQQTRLGVRLAQRLVGDVPAPEVELRLRRRRTEYEAKFPT